MPFLSLKPVIGLISAHVTLLTALTLIEGVQLKSGPSTKP